MPVDWPVRSLGRGKQEGMGPTLLRSRGHSLHEIGDDLSRQPTRRNDVSSSVFRARSRDRPRPPSAIVEAARILTSAPVNSLTRTPVSRTSRRACPTRFEFGGSPILRQKSRPSSSDSTRVAVVSFDRFLSRAQGLAVTSSASSAKLKIFESKACTRLAWIGDPFATTPSQSAMTSLRPIPSKARLRQSGRTCRFKFLWSASAVRLCRRACSVM